MFRIVAWLRRRARTMPRRSPLTSVMPALCIATSVPVPMAMPTWACGERRRVVHAVARHGHDAPLGLQPLDHRRSSGRAAPRPRLVDARACRATASAVARLSPVSITTCTPFRAQERAAPRGVDGLDGVGHADQAATRPSTATNITVCAFAAQRLGPRAEPSGRRPPGPRGALVAERHARARPRGPSPPARSPSETPRPARARGRAARRRPRWPRPADARWRARGCAASRSTSSSDIARRRGHRRERRLALGQGARLVDDERVDLLQRLQGLGVLDQHTGGGAATGADHDRHGRREPERAGARDDEHGHRVHQGVRQARLGPGERPTRRTSPRPPRPRPARTTRTRGRPAAGSARGCAGPRSPCCTIWASSVSLPDPLGPHHEAAGAVDRAAGDAARPAPSPREWARPSPSTRRPRSCPRAPRRPPGPSRRAGRAGGRPTCTCSSGTSSSVPSARSRRAVRGARPRSALMAPLVWLRARSSSTWPSSTSTVITAAASK